MIVVDANILAYLFIRGERTADAEALFRRDPNWAAPRLWRSELRNVLCGYLRRDMLSFEQVCAIQQLAQELLADCEFEVDSRAVLELARDSGCTAYDCEFVALAAQLGTRLITEDKKLLQAFPLQAMPLPAA